MSDLSEYLSGPGKVRFEKAATTAVSIAAAPISAALLWHSRKHSSSASGIEMAERVLGGDRSFEIPKIALSDEGGVPIPGAMLLEKVGLDELPQLREARLGRMALVHVRPIASIDLERRYGAVSDIDRGLADDWVFLRGQVDYDGGVTGPFQIPAHSGETLTPEMHARMEVDYMLAATVRTDIEILGKTALAPFRAII